MAIGNYSDAQINFLNKQYGAPVQQWDEGNSAGWRAPNYNVANSDNPGWSGGTQEDYYGQLDKNVPGYSDIVGGDWKPKDPADFMKNFNSYLDYSKTQGYTDKNAYNPNNPNSMSEMFNNLNITDPKQQMDYAKPFGANDQFLSALSGSQTARLNFQEASGKGNAFSDFFGPLALGAGMGMLGSGNSPLGAMTGMLGASEKMDMKDQAQELQNRQNAGQAGMANANATYQDFQNTPDQTSGANTMPTYVPGGGGNAEQAQQALGDKTGNPTAATGGTNPSSSTIWSGIGDIAGGVGNYLLGQQYTNRLNQNTTNAVNQANPLNNAQRQPYQAGLSNLINNPSQFMQTDPYIKAATQQLQNQGSANFAKSGNLPLEAINQNAAIQQMMAQQYNSRIGQMMTAGGFDQGPGYSGLLALNGGNLAAQGQQNNSQTAMNQLLGGAGQLMGGNGKPGIPGLVSGVGNLFGNTGSAGGNQLSYANDPFGGGGDWGSLFGGMGSGGVGSGAENLSGFSGFNW